jgi:glycosyltransferase involved in cell wall biosynthesis
MKNIEYSVAMCSKNEEETIGKAICSIINQFQNIGEYEIIVVDESTDSTRNILKDLNKKLGKRLSVFFESHETLGDARNTANILSKGKYVLPQIDADDCYYRGVKDFVELFHRIEKRKKGDFYLSGRGINIAPRSLLLEHPYPSLDRGEDKVLWRDLIEAGKFVAVDMEPVKFRIGREPSTLEKVKNIMKRETGLLRHGVNRIRLEKKIEKSKINR